MIDILIADDHPFYREGVRAMLERNPEFQVVSEAIHGEDAIHQALKFRPQVILMDLRMPGRSGIEATREILKSLPDTRILVVSMFDDDESVFAAMRAGAKGYVLKDANRTELTRAIEAVHNGEAIFSAGIATRMLRYFSNPMPEKKDPTIDLADLTEREREVLTLLSRGLSNAEIASELGISMKTVRNHVSLVYDKLQVRDRAQALLKARDAGL